MELLYSQTKTKLLGVKILGRDSGATGRAIVVIQLVSLAGF